ncbi:metalloregulator ArsR/SmtB family transcription factor [Maricaulis sp.]|uniref:metalloregulator ArsR/SmtB family transcription factor n=1 Tax=Maricaulis sp. TaxID=1486257 RepID=UPI00261DC04A|nr:metalloregulator ArsR/SmtB family transcription factor [Maricaulis sp.]
MSDVFKALAHPVRRDVLRKLREGPISAGDLAEDYPVSKPTMSGHFKVLKDAELIVAEKHGTTIKYRLNASVADEALAWLMELVGKDGEEDSTS